MAERPDVERLRTQVETLRDQLADLTEEAGDNLDARRRRAARSMRRAYGNARRYAWDAEEAVEARVGRNPIASLLIAFGVGLVLGKLLDLGRQ